MFYTESLSVPTFGVCYPVTTDALDTLYEKVKPKGVAMTALLTKATAMALAQHPVVNASCKDSKSFTYNSNINIAVVVAINGGLITLVLQDADKMDLYLLSQKWKELVEKACSKQLQPHEYNSDQVESLQKYLLCPIWACLEWIDSTLYFRQGAIMVVGASKPAVVADADGFFSVKSKMLGIDWRVIMDEKARWFERPFERKLSLQFLVMTGISHRDQVDFQQSSFKIVCVVKRDLLRV
ncbi:dihydrolipoyllysine-residue acetyltransferase component 4 of pyruvate dehydrogenase complex, chloroplastic [Morus notabilis]|uniref:dihydrolipoyllysine-residue acetyltransferase component 4 of pyruvate dehydrogenase complex, chloroplastic n=1 Tax=Morus notabilis TaxID=981085 RepID=UPI000CED176F|nr:dihydrolipoyllysine-residue acetyltransferase component 4 of pyruvate dehydrogenase complex, chloroplastic [Morus notabilis]